MDWGELGSVSLAKRAFLIVFCILTIVYPVSLVQAYATSIEVRAQVLPGNYPPVMEPIRPQTVNEGQILIIPIVVSNPEFGETLAYSIKLVNSDLIPQGIWLDTTNDYVEFTWKTNYYQAGSYTFNFSVTDGTYTVYQLVPITVININGPPEILNPPQQPFPLEVKKMSKIDLTVTDPDADPLTCSVDNIPDATCKIKKGQLEIKWKPGADDTIITFITIGVSDLVHTSTYQIPVKFIGPTLIQESDTSIPAGLPDIDSFMAMLESFIQHPISFF
jgi:hypothetical protein